MVPCTCPVQETWMFHCETASLDWIQHGTFAEKTLRKNRDKFQFFFGCHEPVQCRRQGKSHCKAASLEMVPHGTFCEKNVRKIGHEFPSFLWYHVPVQFKRRGCLTVKRQIWIASQEKSRQFWSKGCLRVNQANPGVNRSQSDHHGLGESSPQLPRLQIPALGKQALP